MSFSFDLVLSVAPMALMTLLLYGRGKRSRDMSKIFPEIIQLPGKKQNSNFKMRFANVMTCAGLQVASREACHSLTDHPNCSFREAKQG